MECVFCKIVAGEIPATVEYQNEYCLAFRDIHPAAPVHLLIVPKKHIDSLETAEETEILGEVQLAIAKLINKLKLKNYKVMVNGGIFLEVKHLHYHLLSGFTDSDKKF